MLYSHFADAELSLRFVFAIFAPLQATRFGMTRPGLFGTSMAGRVWSGQLLIRSDRFRSDFLRPLVFAG